MEGDINILLYSSSVKSPDLLFLTCFQFFYYKGRGEKRTVKKPPVSNIEACIHQSLGMFKTHKLNISTLPCGAAKIQIIKLNQ